MNRQIFSFFRQSIDCCSSIKKTYATVQKGTSAFSGGKLGGGLSKKGGAQTQKKIQMPVETDPAKLVKFCCGLNIYKKDGVEVELKPDAEYPAWLWELRTDKGPTIEEMSPDTLEYWSRKRRLALRHKNKLMRDQFPRPFIPKYVKNLRLA